MNGLIQYFKETRAELDHVTWPTQRQTVIYTTLVIALSLIIGVYLSVLDYGLTFGLDRFIISQ
ncbi:MAG: preprotein translocase subunit SecE [Minisyncoccia bacterium]